MTEPAKDTAIDIAPKTQPTQGRVPKIVSEINRTASRVDGRNKKENDHDAEVLENDAPKPWVRGIVEREAVVKLDILFSFFSFGKGMEDKFKMDELIEHFCRSWLGPFMQRFSWEPSFVQALKFLNIYFLLGA